ncbi:TIGR04211 family SH3 domain-containing protein [Marinobacter sp. X15-166B]|uniref:TIGR04211 family SH3 domain-containing protein n=1 Tax=Marinobacter sp. X15-166B TaxID=1897620 RepID=UPI00085BE3E9|nr:TIGR04211 family SH3 domain-containing protein [Marinobacter sp. X15-166B]OEY67141.1 peptide-binding protein [Marinobacter sp. X15-166B]
MTPHRLFAGLLLLMMASTGLHAQTVYIDDTLLAPIRSGEGLQYRILHKGVRSGTPVELITSNRESGYSKVRTREGIEGWIPTRFLTNTPIARDRLAKATQELERAKTQLATLQEELNTLKSERNELASSEQDLESKNAALSEELRNIKSISANALNLDRRNSELREENQKIRNELEVLSAEKERLEAKSESDFMLLGAGLVLLGILLAVLIPWLKPTKKSDNWV